MNCPVCKTTRLAASDLEEELISYQCSACGGQWLNWIRLWTWLDQHRKSSRNVGLGTELDLPVAENPAAKLCPECGHILLRYRVGGPLKFSLDRCGYCGGIWFDRNEWELLRSRNLLEEIHTIFSEAWQSRLRKNAHVQQVEELFRQKIGEQDLAEVKRIKAWLSQHPYGQELCSYLTDSEA